MTPVVMATAAGVIRESAAAARHEPSGSRADTAATHQHGTSTVGRPLPNTSGPADAKRAPGSTRTVLPMPAAIATPTAGAAKTTECRRPADHFFGGARSSHTSTPAPRNTQMISDSVMTVIAPLTR